MGWIREKFEEVKGSSAAPAIECPRGWGPVGFTLRGEAFLPFIEISRKCPIGGVTDCSACQHPYNPDKIGGLRQALDELEQLRAEGVLNDDEAAVRRRGMIGFLDEITSPAENYRIAAWICGPLGIVFAGAGGALVNYIHPGFYAIVAVGAVLLALTISFAAIAGRDTSSRDEWDRRP